MIFNHTAPPVVGFDGQLGSRNWGRAHCPEAKLEWRLTKRCGHQRPIPGRHHRSVGHTLQTNVCTDPRLRDPDGAPDIGPERQQTDDPARLLREPDGDQFLAADRQPTDDPASPLREPTGTRCIGPGGK